MGKQLLLGNAAIALGAIKAGVMVATGYPGTPSSEILDILRQNRTPDLYVEWSVNEKAALEVAAGAAYAGARAMVTMKQVGLNAACDPLLSLAYIGVKGAMVLVVADDPGPSASQTEQDTRHFAQFAHLPVFDPASPAEAYTLIGEAFALSEKYRTPVIFRPTTEICHATASIDITGGRSEHPAEGFVKDPQWVIFPRLSYQNHIKIIRNEALIATDFSAAAYNNISGSGTKGIAASGISVAYSREVLTDTSDDVRFLKLSTVHPFPEKLVQEFLDGLTEVLVIEELDPVIEGALLSVCGKYHLPVKIYGKLTGHLPVAGSNTYENVRAAIDHFFGRKPAALPETNTGRLTVARQPVLCAGCPHRASFYSVKTAMQKANQPSIFSGDIGCYTLGNAPPLAMMDTCLCMGAGITLAQGLQRADSSAKQIAFIGDSTFFHSGITGIINAVYNEADITVIILDNATTAMTGQQPNPGTGQTLLGHFSKKISIEAILRACGLNFVKKVNPFHLETAVATVTAATAFQGVAAVIFEAPCVAVAKPQVKQQVNEVICTGCQRCSSELGCPAITLNAAGKAQINAALCYGCTLCRQICPAKAIGGMPT